MTDYVPNNPECPKCGGSGIDCTRGVHWPMFATCHCQHPGLAARAMKKSDTFKLTCLKCGRSMQIEQRIITRQDTTIDECALCDEERAKPKPITFTDAEGNEFRIGLYRSGNWITARDATPDDLARAGYVPRPRLLPTDPEDERIVDGLMAKHMRETRPMESRELEALRAFRDRRDLCGQDVRIERPDGTLVEYAGPSR